MSRLFLIFQIFLLLLFFKTTLQQNNFYWKTGISGEWNNPNNWIFQNQTIRMNATTIPQTKEDLVFIQASGTYEVALNNGFYTIQSLFVGDSTSKISLKISTNLITVYFNITENANVTIKNTLFQTNHLNIKGNLFLEKMFFQIFNDKITIPKTSVLELQGTTMICKSVEVYGEIYSKDGESILRCPLTNYGVIIQGPKTNSLLFNNLYNYGSLISVSDPLQESTIDTGFYNFGEITLKGEGTHKMSFILFYESSKFNLLNSTLKVNSFNTLYFGNGSVNLGGRIETIEFHYASFTGFLQFNAPLKIVSNSALLGGNGNILFEISKNSNPMIIVEGKALIKSNWILKLNSDLKVGDKIPFIKFNSYEVVGDTILILGNRYLSSKYFFSNGIGYFEIIRGFGFIDSEKRRLSECRYLGNLKNIEFSTTLKHLVLLTFIYPKKSGKIGFGFDINGNITDSLLFINEGATLKPYNHENSTKNSIDLIYSVTEAKEVFSLQIEPGIGPDFKVLNLLIPNRWINNQSFIYYAEINDNSSTHYFEKYSFSISKPSNFECTNFNYPQRVEVFQIGVFITVLLIYIFLFIICLIFIKFRPLNTRGISPLIILFILFSQLILEMRNYFYSLIPQSLCIFSSLTTFPLQLIIYITILLYFIRYFSVINLNESKKAFYDSLKTEPTNQKCLVFKSFLLKVISNPFTLLFINLIFYLIFVLIFLLIFSISNFVCYYDTVFIMRRVKTVLIFVILLSTILLIVIDLILNIKILIRCKWIQYIFYNDPYFFRVQILLFIPLLFYSYSIELYYLQEASFGYLINTFVSYVVLNTIQAKIILFNEVIFPLILTIFELIRSCFRKKESNDEFQKIFKDEVLKQLFKDFCESEYSIENYLCYEDIKNFQQTKHDPLGIYYKYFNGAKSVLEVNVPKKLTQEVYEKIVNDQIDNTLFNQLESSIVANLSDTFSRFIFDSKYLKYMESIKTQQNLVEMK